MFHSLQMVAFKAIRGEPRTTRHHRAWLARRPEGWPLPGIYRRVLLLSLCHFSAVKYYDFNNRFASHA